MSLTCSRFLESSDISNILGLQLSAYDSRELSVSLDLVLCNGV